MNNKGALREQGKQHSSKRGAKLNKSGLGGKISSGSLAKFLTSFPHVAHPLGRHKKNQISSAIKSGRNSAYCFPNLITELCRLSGVRWSQGLEILPTKPMITYRLVNTARAPVARGASRVRGEQDEQTEEAEIVRDEGGPSGQNLASRVDAIVRGFHSMHQDSLQFQGWMTTVLREMTTQTGVAPERIPPWPPVHPDQMDRD